MLSIVLGSVITILAVWANSSGIFVLPASLGAAENEDIAAFYRAGQLAGLGQPAQSYIPEIFQEPFSESNKNLLFLNPPHALLFMQPFASLTYPMAKVTYLVVSALALVGLAFCWAPKSALSAFVLLALSPGIFFTLDYLQLSPIVTFCLTYALLNAGKRPVLSGLLLAFATIKPQYGLLVPVFLAARGYWKTILVATIATLLLMLLSVVIYQLSIWTAFVGSLVSGGHATQAGFLLDLMPTLHTMAGKLGAPDSVRLLTQVTAIFLSACLIWYVRDIGSREERVGVTLLAAAFAAPSFMMYDWLHASVALLLLATGRAPWPLWFQLAAGLLWIAPYVAVFLVHIDPNATSWFTGFMPLLTGFVLFGAVWLLDRTGNVETTPRPVQ